jgi:opacity protein-like surface antigen
MASRPFVVPGIVLALGAALSLATPAPAQTAGHGFLFKPPVISINARGGFGHASAGSDIFSFTTERLTLGREDFSGLSYGGDIGIRITPRLDLSLGASYVGSRTPSEFRDWVDNDDQPIEQTTRFERVPVAASAKLYLTPRGEQVGQFAWIPNRLAPYVGAGAGAMWYRFRQEGDFVDFQTLDIFYEELESQGWTPMAQGMAGVDVALTPRLALTGEGRYLWARDELSDMFEDFDPIDLSGFSATVGLSVRF